MQDLHSHSSISLWDPRWALVSVSPELPLFFSFPGILRNHPPAEGKSHPVPMHLALLCLKTPETARLIGSRIKISPLFFAGAHRGFYRLSGPPPLSTFSPLRHGRNGYGHDSHPCSAPAGTARRPVAGKHLHPASSGAGPRDTSTPPNPGIQSRAILPETIWHTQSLHMEWPGT